MRFCLVCGWYAEGIPVSGAVYGPVRRGGLCWSAGPLPAQPHLDSKPQRKVSLPKTIDLVAKLSASVLRDMSMQGSGLGCFDQPGVDAVSWVPRPQG